jgi:GNAT superfamily N-acetyltransferase
VPADRPNDEVLLRPGLPEEAEAISALALRSKGHWGYQPEFLEACRDDLTTDPRWCDGIRLVVAVRRNVLVGYYRVSGRPPVAELAGLFVDPTAIGSGVGGLLLRDAVRSAGRLGIRTLVIDSDPSAEPFYLHNGAKRTGEAVSTVLPGRMLPQLELDTGPAR